jgi:3-methyladenine DNA glycosylase AlkD
MQLEEILAQLQALANPDAVAGMTRFGINPSGTLGISIPDLRRLGRGLRDHDLAEQLWATGIHEARILAAYIEDPARVTPEQMDRWALDFDSWDIVDQVCSNLFDRTPYAVNKALEWSGRSEEFVKRAGFTLMAALAWHDKTAGDEVFLAFLPVIQREAIDGRNFVKKAVNWALRGIGKRNASLRPAAIQAARAIHQVDSSAARWIASDALRELEKRDEH